MRPTPRTLAQQHRRQTTYEIGAYLDGALLAVLGYTMRPTLATLARAAQAHADILLPHLDPNADDRLSYRAGALTLSPRLVIRKTGRTEREAAATLES
jgi:hypothetical protein